MSSNNSNSAGGGLGFGGALFLVFLVLKLTHTVSWSWWWVFAPLWIPTAITATILLIAGVVIVAKGISEGRAHRRWLREVQGRRNGTRVAPWD